MLHERLSKETYGTSRYFIKEELVNTKVEKKLKNENNILTSILTEDKTGSNPIRGVVP